jgi:hypothetical protein
MGGSALVFLVRYDPTRLVTALLESYVSSALPALISRQAPPTIA